MIKVYDSNEILFNNNGIKILHPLRADITKKINSDYYVELQDTIDNLDFYQSGMIVRIPTPWGVQGFRLTNPIVKNKKVEVKAWHLSYDAKNYVIEDAYAVDKNCNDALWHFNSSTDIPSPFTVISDISTLSSTRAIRKTLFEVYEWLLSTDKYGGYWERDNWVLGIRKNIGQDRGVVLSVGKNLSSIQISEEWKNVCTKIMPYTTDGDNAVMLDETYVETSEQLYDIPYTKIVKFKNDLDADDFGSEAEYEQAIKERLRKQAEDYLEENKIPKVNYSVSANIDDISDVGDTIQVKHPKCKVNILTTVISVQYDAIRKKYTKIQFGNFKNELKNISSTITAEANKHTDEVVEETQILMKGELDKATAEINGVLGNSYVIYDGDKILVVDKLPKETAKNVLKISSGGIGFSNTGINGDFISAWTIEGELLTQNLKAFTITASMIMGGTLTLGGVNNSSGTFELKDEAGTTIAEMNKDGLTVKARNGNYVKLNADDGIVGYNKNDARVYWADGETFHMHNAEIENETKIAGKIKMVPVSTLENVGIGFVALV